MCCLGKCVGCVPWCGGDLRSWGMCSAGARALAVYRGGASRSSAHCPGPGAVSHPSGGGWSPPGVNAPTAGTLAPTGPAAPPRQESPPHRGSSRPGRFYRLLVAPVRACARKELTAPCCTSSPGILPPPPRVIREILRKAPALLRNHDPKMCSTTPICTSSPGILPTPTRAIPEIPRKKAGAGQRWRLEDVQQDSATLGVNLMTQPLRRRLRAGHHVSERRCKRGLGPVGFTTGSEIVLVSCALQGLS